MILNTTIEPLDKFSAMQRLALNGEQIEHRPVATIEDFEDVFITLKDVTAVIVDPKNIVLANDILNYVSCPVLTLGIEAIVDTDKVNFLLYDGEEDI